MESPPPPPPPVDIFSTYVGEDSETDENRGAITVTVMINSPDGKHDRKKEVTDVEPKFTIGVPNQLQPRFTIGDEKFQPDIIIEDSQQQTQTEIIIDDSPKSRLEDSEDQDPPLITLEDSQDQAEIFKRDSPCNIDRDESQDPPEIVLSDDDEYFMGEFQNHPQILTGDSQEPPEIFTGDSQDSSDSVVIINGEAPVIHGPSRRMKRMKVCGA